MDEQSGELVEHYKALTDELEEKNRILMATLTEKDNQMKRVQEQYEAIMQTNKEKDDQIVDLEFELLAQSKSSVAEDDYVKQMKEKDEEIARLNSKLVKRTCDLQGLVNNELWQKNREIEKLQKLQASKLIETKDLEIEKLQNDVKSKEKQLILIKEKISELENGAETNLRTELEKSEKLRAEANELCLVLSRRLEELAVFLDSLLKQKSVLGFLGNKENKRLRQIIDQSLDLSRSFTMSMMVNPEQSLVQLTNISSVLNDEEDVSASRFSIIPGNISLTYRSHLHRKDNEDNSQIIQTLRQQIVNLKYELQLRDVELSKMSSSAPVLTEPSSDKDHQKCNLNTTSTTLKYKSDNQSESEAWSEPDRSVSRARIGLQTTPSKKSVGQASTDSTEDEEGASPRKKGVLAESRNTIIELHKQVCELDQKLNDKEMAYYEATRTNNKLKQELREAEAKLENLQELNIKNKELHNKINEMEVQKREAAEAADIMQHQHEEKIQALEEESMKTIKQIQNSAEKEIRTLHETIEQLHLEYSMNYVKKRQVEEAVEEIERLKSELEALEDRMDQMNQEQQKLSEYEDTINGLRSDLDIATLQYSEAVLDKTKLANEKALIEQELSRSALKEVDAKKRLDEAENEMANLRQTYQKQVSTLHDQKCKLEVRVSELESSNAELHNRLIKIQAGCGDHVTSSSLPNTPNFVNQIVSFRRQHSEYLSEEQYLLAGRLVPNQNMDLERNEANSSPDLGIESDHGRFSSLETHVQRPLLQTLELTESMSNLLDMEGAQEISCGADHCCRKTLEMANENTDLKRKLLRTRRALEETVTQLTLANQRKKQVEKTICKQIHKTSQVLRKAKANLDSGSETDAYRN